MKTQAYPWWEPPLSMCTKRKITFKCPKCDLTPQYVESLKKLSLNVFYKWSEYALKNENKMYSLNFWPPINQFFPLQIQIFYKQNVIFKIQIFFKENLIKFKIYFRALKAIVTHLYKKLFISLQVKEERTKP